MGSTILCAPNCELFCRFSHIHDASWCAPRAERLARALGLAEHESAELAIVVSELVTNAVKYAGGGELVVRALDAAAGTARVGIEVVVSDDGPGIVDVDAASVEGYSQGSQHEPGCNSPGSLGTGLGAVRRLSDEVEFSRRGGRGLIVRAVKYAR